VDGATISYGTWSWWIGGITVASLGVAALLYLVGRMTGPGEPSVPAGARRAGPGGGRRWLSNAPAFRPPGRTGNRAGGGCVQAVSHL
jgi:hypothetical protein